MDVAVVGAGIHGLSAARRLAEKGHRTVLFDPRPVGHGLGSSHGSSRIVRRAYPDAYHTGLMTEAYPLWRELEQASQTSLFSEVGLLCFGPQSGEYVAGLSRALGSQAVEHQVLDARSAREYLPQFDFAADEGAVFVPEAGWVSADAALQATYALAIAAGVEHVPTEAEGLERFDRAVICAGPWVRRFWPGAPVRVTLQTTALVKAASSGPVWIEDGPDLLYGFPNLPKSPGAKVGVHRAGDEIDADSPLRLPSVWMIDAIAKFGNRRLGLAEPEILEATSCLYTVTADEGFLFHALDAKTLVVSACSGHGFKFGPWVGTRIAAMLG